MILKIDPTEFYNFSINDRPFSGLEAWIWLLTHADTYGNINFSFRALANKFNWRFEKLKRFLSFLESNKKVVRNEIGTHTVTKTEQITIINIDSYKDMRNEIGTPTVTKTEHLLEQNITTILEQLKNIETEIKDLHKRPEMKKFIKPTLEELKTEFFENKCLDFTYQAEQFFNHFESNGWKIGGKAPMKSWKATVKTWIARLNEKEKSTKKLLMKLTYNEMLAYCQKRNLKPSEYFKASQTDKDDSNKPLWDQIKFFNDKL